jgi:GTPase Era involved in 16S rRNA processing
LQSNIPEFAIVGHPNEGKSSVVSTLAEDDSVRISATPGETIRCQTFTVTIDGNETIRFIDTPGFQNPKQTLQWMQEYQGADELIVKMFLDSHRDNPDFKDDCELFNPIANGAGIIYVVDGSRPIRNVDRAEMETLRLTGRPRLAIINCKENETQFLDSWRNEFRKHFNSVRIFNAHRATYSERIELLQTLKSIDQEWQPALELAIKAFIADWRQRNTIVADLICVTLEKCLTYSVSKSLDKDSLESEIKITLKQDYIKAIERFESKAQQQIRRLFKHNIFHYDLPPQSIIHENLFSKKTWELLGLNKRKLIIAGAMSGAAVAGVIDLMFGGSSLGIFMTIGGASGAGFAAFGGVDSLAQSKILGKFFGKRDKITVTANMNIQYLFILLDRLLIYYAHIINWAHGRRDYEVHRSPVQKNQKIGFTDEWNSDDRKICSTFFSAVHKNSDSKRELARKEFMEMLQKKLLDISQTDNRYWL